MESGHGLMLNTCYFSSDSIGSATGSGPASPTPSPTPDADGSTFNDTTSRDGITLVKKDFERREKLCQVMQSDQDKVRYLPIYFSTVFVAQWLRESWLKPHCLLAYNTHPDLESKHSCIRGCK